MQLGITHTGNNLVIGFGDYMMTVGDHEIHAIQNAVVRGEEWGAQRKLGIVNGNLRYEEDHFKFLTPRDVIGSLITMQNGIIDGFDTQVAPLLTKQLDIQWIHGLLVLSHGEDAIGLGQIDRQWLREVLSRED